MNRRLVTAEKEDFIVQGWERNQNIKALSDGAYSRVLISEERSGAAASFYYFQYCETPISCLDVTSAD